MFNKYRAKKTIVDNIKFDSMKESQRYLVLKQSQQADMIAELELQPRFDIIVNGKFCGFYKADFKYFDIRQERWIVEDVKGFRTAIFNLKKKLIEALYDTKITIT